MSHPGTRRSRSLGPTARCLLCPQSDPRALGRYPRAILEEHHVVARLNDDELTAVLCRNCHAVLTDRQEDWDHRLLAPETPLERLAALLQGAVDWLLQLARKMTDLAVLLHQCVRWLLSGMTGPPPV